MTNNIDCVVENDLKSFNSAEISRKIVHLLSAKKYMLSVAESLTGGMLAASIVDVAGASAVFYEGVVSYNEIAKRERLGVRAETLEHFGAVSAETAAEMSKGLLKHADIAVSTTGLAGPDGGSAEKPVGLVYFGLSTRNETLTFKRIFVGDRREIRKKATDFALNILFLHLSETK